MSDSGVDHNGREVVGGLMSDLEAYKARLSLTIFRALTLIEAKILENLRGKSGLHVRSGALLNSIGASKRVFEDAGYIVGEIGSQGVPYARIHEFGGTTKPHEIRPRVREALAFKIGGKQVFAKVVHHPGSRIPARPYLRPALEDSREQILKEFGLLIRESFKGTKE